MHSFINFLAADEHTEKITFVLNAIIASKRVWLGEKPNHAHDACDACIFIFSFCGHDEADLIDLWFCQDSGTLMARYSDEGGDYRSTNVNYTDGSLMLQMLQI